MPSGSWATTIKPHSANIKDTLTQSDAPAHHHISAGNQVVAGPQLVQLFPDSRAERHTAVVNKGTPLSFPLFVTYNSRNSCIRQYDNRPSYKEIPTTEDIPDEGWM